MPADGDRVIAIVTAWVADDYDTAAVFIDEAIESGPSVTMQTLASLCGALVELLAKATGQSNEAVLTQLGAINARLSNPPDGSEPA